MELRKPQIIDRGRGPEIKGTRITVYHVMDYYLDGDHHTAIACSLGLSSAEVLCAIEYIEAHRQEVYAEYQRILARCERGNPPELRAKLEKSHEKLLKFREELRRRKEMERAEAAGRR